MGIIGRTIGLLSVLLSTAVILPCSPASATTWYVRQDGSDSAGGSGGWGDAFATISNAVAHAQSNDTVLVSNGVYAITEQISVTNAITVLGYAGSSNTFIGGLYPASTSRCLYVTHPMALVAGFTLTNGWTTLADRYGGALYMTAGVISNCVFGESRGYDYGGGIYIAGGTLVDCTVRGNILRDGGGGWTFGGGVFMAGGVITNCLVVSNGFVNNYHTFGGGIRMSAGTVRNSIIIGNFISSFRRKQGGGVWMSAGTLENCVVAGNYTLGGSDGNDDGLKGGGGIWMEGAGALVRNCLVRGNESSDNGNDKGGGIRVESGAIHNCTVSRNQSAGSGGIHNSGGYVSNTIAFANAATTSSNLYSATGVGYSCAPELSGGPGNLASDPLFASSATGYGTNSGGGDFHLQLSSPCVDAGTNIATVTADLDGVARPCDGNGDSIPLHDIGCYEKVPDTNDVLCNFSANTNAGFGPLTVVFTATVGGNTNGVVYYWDFGNGTASGGARRVVTNVYNPAAGAYYTVTLSVTNDSSAGSSSIKPSYIKVFIDSDVYVSPGGSGTPPYQTWGTAANGIQSAIDAAAGDIQTVRPGTRVIVTNGTYALSAQLSLAQGITVRSVNGPSNTFVNGAGIAGVRCLSMSHTNAVFDGLSLTNGRGLNFGAGVNISAGTIRNCTIGWNRMDDDGGGWMYGGGVYMTGGTISNCVIRNNYHTGSVQTFGGGVFMSAGSVIGCALISNSVAGNTAEQGAGIDMAGGTVQDCIFTGNFTSRLSSQGVMDGRYGGGAGLCVRGASCLVRNCLIAGNSVVSTNTGGNGGGLRLAAGTVQSCTIARNQSGTSCGGVYMTGGSISNTIVYANSAPATNDINLTANIGYSCSPDLVSGDGNLTADPAFRDPGAGYGTNAVLGAYNLRYRSPCINVGFGQPWMTASHDLAGNVRINQLLVDIGAYECWEQAGTIFVVH